jgi:Tfp pilus assembly protein PilN
MPRVNLLPPEIAEKATLRRSQMAMGCVGLAAVAVVGVMYVQKSAQVSSANATKTEAVAASTKLKSDLAALKSVSDTYAQVDAAKATLAQAMQYDVTWSTYLHNITLNIPENVWLTSLTASVQAPGAPGNAAVPGRTVLDPGLGSVTIAGYAMDHPDVGSWLESLAKTKGYLNPYFTQAAEDFIGDTRVVKFTSSVNLTQDALSKKYTPKGLAR